MMVANLIAALREDLTTLSWMSQETLSESDRNWKHTSARSAIRTNGEITRRLQINRGAYYNNRCVRG